MLVAVIVLMSVSILFSHDTTVPVQSSVQSFQPMATSFASNSSGNPTIDVYIVSTYPGQPQQLFAYPGQAGILMYPHWNITISVSQVVLYSIYVNGGHVASGTGMGLIYADVYINASIGSAVVGVGNHIYNFSNLPISVIPLSKRYAPAPPPLIYTQEFLNLFTVRTIVGAILLTLASILTVGQITVSRKERTITRS